MAGTNLHEWSIRRSLANRAYDDNIQADEMIDFERITGFDWDQGNERKNVDKHDVSQAEAEQVFFNYPLRIVVDPAHSEIEPRWDALGVTDSGRLLQVAFTLRQSETKIRVISARAMSRKERKIYEQES